MSIYERLARGEISQQAWARAGELANAMWDRCGFPRVKAPYSNDKIIPDRLLPSFWTLHRHFLTQEGVKPS